MKDWLVRSLAAFLVIGGIALFFVHRLSQPFKALAIAANSFASELEVTELEETGPRDVKRAIRSFNVMQRQVTEEMKRRASTLAAISHDIRTPLTALRVKSELIDDERLRADHIASIDKMERITASALDFLKGESRNEPIRQINLGELVDSVCAEFQELGGDVRFECPSRIDYACRPDALTRAVNNLIENAVKYAGSADVSIICTEQQIEIAVTDSGPGIPSNKVDAVFEPFERLCQARDSDTGGFGLGLAIANAIAKGHDGALTLTANSPTGLIATLKLPLV
jgi:signal transduction histidine kinase